MQNIVVRDTDDITLLIKDIPEFRTKRLIALTHLIEISANNVLRLIESVSDHEGWLTVTWKIEPSYEERQLVSKIWGNVGEEPRCTTHIFEGKEYFR